jgi:hypothetical protein
MIAYVLCLVRPTCFDQLDHGPRKVAKEYGEDFHTPSIYYLQLLAFAQGTPNGEPGVGRQRFTPECLRRCDGGIAAVVSGTESARSDAGTTVR